MVVEFLKKLLSELNASSEYALKNPDSVTLWASPFEIMTPEFKSFLVEKNFNTQKMCEIQLWHYRQHIFKSVLNKLLTSKVLDELFAQFSLVPEYFEFIEGLQNTSDIVMFLRGFEVTDISCTVLSSKEAAAYQGYINFVHELKTSASIFKKNSFSDVMKDLHAQYEVEESEILEWLEHFKLQRQKNWMSNLRKSNSQFIRSDSMNTINHEMMVDVAHEFKRAGKSMALLLIDMAVRRFIILLLEGRHSYDQIVDDALNNTRSGRTSGSPFIYFVTRHRGNFEPFLGKDTVSQLEWRDALMQIKDPVQPALVEYFVDLFNTTFDSQLKECMSIHSCSTLEEMSCIDESERKRPGIQ